MYFFRKSFMECYDDTDSTCQRYATTVVTVFVVVAVSELFLSPRVLIFNNAVAAK